MNQNTKIQNQFGVRIPSFNTAANWMLDTSLIDAHIKAAGQPTELKNSCLELCCGTGVVGKVFKQQGWQVTGIDLTKEMANESAKYFDAHQGNIYKMPFKDNSFDVAVLRQSYKLIDGPRALKEIYRVLKNNGTFILGQSVSFSEKDEAQYYKTQVARHIYMIKYYTTQDFINEINSNGFKITNTTSLRIRESVNKWLTYAFALPEETKTQIFNLIKNAPRSYIEERKVTFKNGELEEDWNWVIFSAKVQK